MWSSLWSMGCITTHCNISPFFLLEIERSNCLAVCEAQLHFSSWRLSGYSCRVVCCFLLFFTMWCWGRVHAFNVCSMALGHLNALKRRRHLQVLTTIAYCNPHFCQCLLCLFIFFSYFTPLDFLQCNLSLPSFVPHLLVATSIYCWSKENPVWLNVPINDNEVFERW